MQLARKEDWPARLAREIQLAQRQPYKLGTHDCLRFVCRCIAAMTGVDYWPRFAGYNTRREALRTIARIAPSLSAAVSLVLDQTPMPAVLAHRGDVVLYRDTEGEHLGICVGQHVGVLGPAGLILLRLDHPGVAEAWRIG